MDAKALQAIPGVGASIAEKIVEFLQTGSVAAIEKLRAKIPAGVRAMTVVPGLGPRKAMLLYEQLGIDSVAGLEEAIAEGRLAGLRGFGAKTAENLLHGIQLARARDRPGADRHRDGHGRGDRRGHCRPCPGVCGAPTPARCAGCGRPSATSTSWPPPRTRGP